MAKLTQAGNELLVALKARKAESKAKKASEIEADASRWAKERVVTLKKELETAGLGDALRVHSLADKQPSKEDWLKIRALDAALGIDIMTKAEIRNFAYAGEPTDWIVEIIVEDLLELLESASKS
ncbi:hypothetical protein HZC53_00870 [Candidatus Uhrbacteria bacterium]|nr:hypothetical protein [Candidatus Uhrbacteria bacterium]